MDAVAAVDALDRRTIRAAALERFSVARMVEQYLAVYRSVLAQRP